MLIHKFAKTFGPFCDGRTVSAWGYPGLPGWAWESLLIKGEPGCGLYMTLPRVAAPNHPYLDEEHLGHPMLRRYYQN